MLPWSQLHPSGTWQGLFKLLAGSPAAAHGPHIDHLSWPVGRGGEGDPGPGVLPCRVRKVALSPARTHGLRAVAEGPATWRTVGRKLAAGGRVAAETAGDHAGYGTGKPGAGVTCSGAGGA